MPAKHLPLSLVAMGAEGVWDLQGDLTVRAQHLRKTYKKYPCVGLRLFFLFRENPCFRISGFLLSLAANFSSAGDINDEFSSPNFTIYPCLLNFLVNSISQL